MRTQLARGTCRALLSGVHPPSSAGLDVMTRPTRPVTPPTPRAIEGLPSYDLDGLDDESTTVHPGFADGGRTVVRAPLPTLPPDTFPPALAPLATPAAVPVPAAEGFHPAPGTTLAGKYQLLEKIAQGTFGLVYTARDTNLDREVAIKILNPAHVANVDILQRFLQEARAAARIAHPGIVTMFDCGHFDTGAFIAMELLAGESLTVRLARSTRLAPGDAIEIARQVASALDAAHRVDILHRDLKPDNIYIVPDPAMPAGERVKVLDFGLAKLGDSGQTHLNTIFGTPRYMSPEQCRSATQLDQRSDIYSLGCILFELATGRTPFDGNLRELVERHQRAPIPRAKLFAPEISQQLEDLIMLMLQKDPAARPQTMGAVVRKLQSLPERAVRAPLADATVMPMAVQLLALAPTQSTPVNAATLDASSTTSWPRLRRAPIIAAVIAFVVAGALTAIAARGSTKRASPDPVPAASVVPQTPPGS
ncbi:MAG: serine/threonine protein kinase [Myxococcota bacterium]|nr:serine/threonine protein kinase [Myxococcota bacterium]